MNKLKQLFDKLNCKSSCCTGSVSIDLDGDKEEDIHISIIDGNVIVDSPARQTRRILSVVDRLQLADRVRDKNALDTLR